MYFEDNTSIRKKWRHPYKTGLFFSMAAQLGGNTTRYVSIGRVTQEVKLRNFFVQGVLFG